MTSVDTFSGVHYTQDLPWAPAIILTYKQRSFHMSPKFKFPRIEAGLYQVVKDKEPVGLIQKQVDGKEVTWWIYNTTNVDEIGAVTCVGNPDDLLREAKDVAQKYFTENTSPKSTVIEKEVVVEPQEKVKKVELEEDFFDSMSAFEDFEDSFDNEEVDLSDIDLSYSEEEELALV